MKKILWLLMALAVLGGGVLAKEPAAGGGKGRTATINGTLKVAGGKITVTADDGATYLLKSGDEKALATLKAKDGQRLELKGKAADEDGTKTLTLASKGGGRKKDAAPGGGKK
jgi:hypothetical protein